MRYAVVPRQMTLFEPAAVMFSPITIKYLSSDWPGVFRYQMLHLMPAEALGKHFDAKLGCPTKELYGMAGAILLKEFFNLTIPQTVERYLTEAAWQYTDSKLVILITDRKFDSARGGGSAQGVGVQLKQILLPVAKGLLGLEASTKSYQQPG